MTQEASDDPDEVGYLRLSLHVTQTRDMLPWIRGWGAEVEVLEPRELRDELMGETRRMGELYGWRLARDGPDDGLSEEVDFFGGGTSL